jgi:hypothetical protein
VSSNLTLSAKWRHRLIRRPDRDKENEVRGDIASGTHLGGSMTYEEVIAYKLSHATPLRRFCATERVVI